MDLLYLLDDLEDSDNLHLSRILILLNVFAGREGKNSIDGITKLAKLDFFLRYPIYLKKALKARKIPLKKIQDFKIEQYEENSVESKMVRYRYGPWDFRYNKYLNQLIAKNLIRIERNGKMIKFFLTSKGLEISKKLAIEKNLINFEKRSRFLKTYLNLSATNLMKFVYNTFPEIGNLKFGEKIL